MKVTAYLQQVWAQLFAIGLFVPLAMVSCRQAHSKDSVVIAVQQYDRLIKKMDADFISMLFTSDGELGNMAQGRDAIKKFLSGFANIQVLSQVSAIGYLHIGSDTATVKGVYWQTDLADKKDTLHVKGSFTSKWIWIPPMGRRLKRITTSPTR